MSSVGSRRMDFPSPRGAHVPESYYAGLDPDDPYRRPSSLRNRYSRPAHQAPRVRNVTWVSSQEPVTPQTPRAPPSPWLAPSHAPSTPARRPPTPIPPSPAPTVGEHMSLDDFAFVQDDVADPSRRPQRPGLIKSIWRGFKKLSGLDPSPSFLFPRPASYGSQTFPMPIPVPSAPSDATQYVNPTPPETSGTRTTGTEERRSTTPHGSPYAPPASSYAPPASPYARPASPYAQLPSPYARPPSPYARPPSPYARPASSYARPASVRATPAAIPGSMRASPAIRPPSPYARPTSPYARPASVRATPAAIPGSMRASPVPVSFPITVISPSDSSSALPTPRSAHAPSPVPSLRHPSAAEPFGTLEGSQTLHEHVPPDPARPHAIAAPVPILRAAPTFLQHGVGVQFSPVDSKGSPSSTMARFRRFIADVDSLPWISDAQIADEYVPEKTPRSRLRAKMRQGAEPSWYNPRPEREERPAYWSEWDMWAKQSTAALGDGGHVGWAGVGAGGGLGQGQGEWGAAYPHGSMPVQPGLHMYPSGYPPPGEVDSEYDAPVLP